MAYQNELISIDIRDLVSLATDLHAKAFRLVLITARNDGDMVDLTYSFEKDYAYRNLRFQVPAKAQVPSISAVWQNAFAYENELQDLFGLSFPGLTLNFNGTFYRPAVKTPFAVQTPAVK